MRPAVFFCCRGSIIALAVCGCGVSDKDHQATLRSARIVLPIAVQMESLFPPADHFVSQFGRGSTKGTLWHTNVYIGGRYVLAMEVPVELDFTGHTINVVGKPDLYLMEVPWVTVSPDGALSTGVGAQFALSEDDWNKVQGNLGDFSTIGIDLNPSRVVDFDTYAAAEMSHHQLVRLVDN